MKLKVFLFILCLFWVQPAYAATIIYQQSFNYCADWSITQTTSDKENIPDAWTYGQTDFPCGVNAYSGTGPRFYGWGESQTYLTNNVHNTVTLSSSNCRSGKCITHYSEVPSTSSGGNASSGALYLSLADPVGGDDAGYSEIWVTVWRKFQPGYYTSKNTQKFFYASHYNAASSHGLRRWIDAGDPDSHAPCVIQGTQGYDSVDAYGYKLRFQYYMVNLFPYANRNDYTWSSGDLNCGIYQGGAGDKYIFTYATLQSGTKDGGWQQSGNYGDGNYYVHEYHLKLNSAPGVADGVLEYYIDGRCQMSISNIPWIKSGTSMRKWNMVVFGGNNDYINAAGEYECYYAYDDIVISDYRVGKDYVINDYRTTGGAAVIGARIK